MTLRLLALFAASFFAAVLARAENHPFKEPFSRTAPFNPDGKISLHNVNGSVEIRTWDKNEIRIEGEKSAKSEEELRLIDLTLDLSPAVADINVRLPKRPGTWGKNTIRAAVSFTLTVPARATLENINTVNSSIQIEGVHGPVRAATVNGRIHAANLGHDARLRTVNGQIDASFTTVAAGQELSFDTVNGSIHVAFPADVGLRLSGSVVNGHIDCDFPLEVRGKIGRKRISGKIGDGRAALHAESVNGSIHLDRR